MRAPIFTECIRHLIHLLSLIMSYLYFASKKLSASTSRQTQSASHKHPILILNTISQYLSLFFLFFFIILFFSVYSVLHSAMLYKKMPAFYQTKLCIANQGKTGVDQCHCIQPDLPQAKTTRKRPKGTRKTHYGNDNVVCLLTPKSARLVSCRRKARADTPKPLSSRELYRSV